MKRLDGFLFISDIVAVEVLNTFRSKLNRGSLAPGDYRHARESFFKAYPAALRTQAVGPDVVADTLAIVSSHKRKSVGGVDVLHLATALRVQKKLPSGFRIAFATADAELATLADETGMHVFNPLSDPLSSLPRRPAN